MCYNMHIMDKSTDSLDKQLVELLMQDARVSSNVLAKQLNISSSTVRRRMKKLVEHGIIHIIALPEPSKIGKFMEAVIALDVSHEKINLVVEKLSKYPEVRWIAVTSGRFDIMAYVWLNSTEYLYKFIEEDVGRLEGIRNSETFICLHVEKHP